MTMHTKAATDDIYDIFNAPLKQPQQEEEGLLRDEDYETDDYTSGGESSTTGKNVSTSEVGDDDEEYEERGHALDDTSDVKSVSEWSEFSTGRHIPGLDRGSDNEDEERDHTEVSDLIDIHES